MKIENAKDLQALIKLCRKHGVESIEVDGVKLTLSPDAFQTKPQRKRRVKQELTSDGTIDVSDIIDVPEELTPEQLLFYSAIPQDGTVGEQ